MEMGIETLCFLQIRLPLRCNIYSHAGIKCGGVAVVSDWCKVSKTVAERYKAGAGAAEFKALLPWNRKDKLKIPLGMRP